MINVNVEIGFANSNAKQLKKEKTRINCFDKCRLHKLTSSVSFSATGLFLH